MVGRNFFPVGNEGLASYVKTLALYSRFGQLNILFY